MGRPENSSSDDDGERRNERDEGKRVIDLRTQSAGSDIGGSGDDGAREGGAGTKGAREGWHRQSGAAEASHGGHGTAPHRTAPHPTQQQQHHLHNDDDAQVSLVFLASPFLLHRLL
jgi:hypothetical protein